ncbi:MAG: FHA domain-containing protein, partial [Planctomycetaceae bacterium]|nr:FHA domain-containing protein [Planctomycetaceae bacterium]
MLQDCWEETVAAKTVKPVECGVGCLLQIYPLEVSSQLIRLTDSKTPVGREQSCGLCLPDASVSRRHALIELVNNEYQVSDLGSTNGTMVNECRLTSAVLKPGDRLQFGSFIFKFLST